MLDHRLRRCSNIKPTLGQHLVVVGYHSGGDYAKMTTVHISTFYLSRLLQWQSLELAIDQTPGLSPFMFKQAESASALQSQNSVSAHL